MDSSLLTEPRGGSVLARKTRLRPSAEDIAWVGLVPATAALIACLLWLAPPLSDLYPGPTYRLFPEIERVARPEPLEATRFLFAVVIPLGLAGLVLLGSPAPSSGRFGVAVIALQTAGIGLIAWGVVEQDRGPVLLLPPGYFEPLLLSVPVLVLGLVIGVGLILVALGKPRVLDRIPLPAAASPAWRRGAFVGALLVTAAWLLPAVVTDDTVALAGVKPGGRLVVAESCVPRWFYAVEKRLFKVLVALSKTPLLGGHPPTIQIPFGLLVSLVAEQLDVESAYKVPPGRWITQFGRRWPTALTPARAYMVVGRRRDG